MWRVNLLATDAAMLASQIIDGYVTKPNDSND